MNLALNKTTPNTRRDTDVLNVIEVVDPVEDVAPQRQPIGQHETSGFQAAAELMWRRNKHNQGVTKACLWDGNAVVLPQVGDHLLTFVAGVNDVERAEKHRGQGDEPRNVGDACLEAVVVRVHGRFLPPPWDWLRDRRSAVYRH